MLTANSEARIHIRYHTSLTSIFDWEYGRDGSQRQFDNEIPPLYVQEAIAYALARAGDVAQAAMALDQLVGLLDEKVPWQCEMADRARALKSQMVSNPADVQRQLEAWEAESVHNLGLEVFR